VPVEHLLRHVLLVPLGCGLGVALIVLAANSDRWPAWTGLAFAAAVATALLLHPNFAAQFPPRSAEAALPWAAAAFALFGLIRLPGPATGLGRHALDAAVLLPPAGWIAWLSASEVREYYAWQALVFAGVVVLATLAAAASVLLHRTVARKHAASAVLIGWLLTGSAVSLALLFGHTAKGAEFAGVLCAVLGPGVAVALWRGQSARADAFAAPFAGAVFAALLLGLLQAELIWISAALLVLLSAAAGLLNLRSRGVWATIGGIGIVTLLPAAAAVFLAFMRAAVEPGSDGGSALP
jgi:hypothetical protein